MILNRQKWRIESESIYRATPFLAGFEEMTKTAEKSSGLISVTGCIDAQKSQMIYAFGGHRKNKLIVTFGEQKAKELYDEYSFLTKRWCIIHQRMCFFTSRISGAIS